MIGSLNRYEGVKGSWVWCVSVCERSDGEYGSDACVKVVFDEGNG